LYCAGVDCSDVVRVAGHSVGTFTVHPELKTVSYQRRQAAFATQDPTEFDWNTLLAPKDGLPKWLHMTGITPMVSSQARATWIKALDVAFALKVPVSMDFNHRKQLGPLDDLWSVMQPVLSKLEVIIFSLDSLMEVVELEGDAVSAAGKAPAGASKEDPKWRMFMAETRKRWDVPRLARCSVFDSILHSRMSLVPTPAHLKRACV
jgi:sugar/nucleoside kinase (ribokinase family)